MKLRNLTAAVLSLLLFAGCGKEQYPEAFENCDPVDLSEILHAHMASQDLADDKQDSIVQAMLYSDLPEDEDNSLMRGNSFVLRLPEYESSPQPFLAKAEEFYNSSLFFWNLYSNFEVWQANKMSDELMSDDEVRRSIEGLDVNVIHDKDIRDAAQNYKDSMLLLMSISTDGWTEEANPSNCMATFEEVLESKAYKFFEDEETFYKSLDEMMDASEEMAMDKFQHYLDADKEKQLRVILGELAACRNFDEQCSLWRNWANCKKSLFEDDWILVVGKALMDSGKYSPILNRIWVTWRAVCQIEYFGLSRFSEIPNQYYNEYRKKCYVTCLKRIAAHPDDAFAMNCAAAIGGRANMNRFGQNYFGNEAMIEEAMMMPNRLGLSADDDDEDVDDGDNDEEEEWEDSEPEEIEDDEESDLE